MVVLEGEVLCRVGFGVASIFVEGPLFCVLGYFVWACGWGGVVFSTNEGWGWRATAASYLS